MIDLHNAVYSLLKPVADVMKLNLIHSFQNAERVVKPYASIRIDTSTVHNHEIYFPVKETGYQDFGNSRRATIEIQVYGKNAGVGARRFALGLKSPSSLDRATMLNIAVTTNMFLSEVPELINLTQYEERGIYQFQLLYSDEMEDEVGLIETVEISHEKETIWDDMGTIWDDVVSDVDTVWDEMTTCEVSITAYPPYTPVHPGQPDDAEA